MTYLDSLREAGLEKFELVGQSISSRIDDFKSKLYRQAWFYDTAIAIFREIFGSREKAISNQLPLDVKQAY